MTRQEIFERLINLIQKQRSYLSVAITEQTHLKNDLAVDSIELVEFIINVEDEFYIAIPDEDVEDMVFMRDVLDYLVQRLT
ncbi:phosphopantetheine-binding protein [Streptococcus pyogenes]|uniref:phosphopantetheine-binding protein n=1 Tax=Streptococcus pyogenes TaxID=1314 RepID=UPI0010A161E8|nr:phosphopantetheine-binding protein [Streptococcus pyogenes]VHA72982.1 acyl carrier protein [Streptococcus pyogenes]VHD01145.1 acyl carrier protein [Streptococcus pyogenes]VHD06035.1 acyl carrier protein [Streptococcus pyogenes]VHD15303.1 acyl carrier protein [Streptococcus pyogenes]HER5565814.1 acyl carrier protein [Streptococcus pyogenes]